MNFISKSCLSKQKKTKNQKKPKKKNKKTKKKGGSSISRNKNYLQTETNVFNFFKHASGKDIVNYIKENNLAVDHPFILYLCINDEERDIVRSKMYDYIDKNINNFSLPVIVKLINVFIRIQEEAIFTSMNYIEKLTEIIKFKSGSDIRNYLCHYINYENINFNDPIILQLLYQDNDYMRDKLKNHIINKIKTFSEPTTNKLLLIVGKMNIHEKFKVFNEILDILKHPK